MKLEWNPIKGYEGLYQVNTLGDVRSLERMKPYRNGQRKLYGKVLRQNINTCGYCQVVLYKDGTRKPFTVHRLVAEAFLPNPKGHPQINHIDGDKTNNSVNNLEWCSPKENMIHSLKANLRSDAQAVEMLSKSGEVLRTFRSIREAERETEISRVSIMGCCARKHGYKTAGGYVWRYRKEQ